MRNEKKPYRKKKDLPSPKWGNCPYCEDCCLEISNDDYYFMGSYHPPRHKALSEVFQLQHYCKKCYKKFPKNLKKPKMFDLD